MPRCRSRRSADGSEPVTLRSGARRVARVFGRRPIRPTGDPRLPMAMRTRGPSDDAMP
jgi:hypothetical protein